MAIVLDPFTGQLIDTGPSSATIDINGPVNGASPNSVLVVDGASTLQDVPMPLDGQLLIGSAGNLPVAATLTGTADQVIISNGAGSITLGLPQSVATTSSPQFANLNITTGGSINSATNGGLLNIGSNAGTINIGNGVTPGNINLYGSTFYQEVINLEVTDKNILLNKNGAIASGFDSGISIEENGSVTGYAQVSSDRNSWLLKAPNTAGEITLTPGATGFTIDQGSHNPVTISGTPNGLSIDGSQVLSIALASSTTTGALSSTDWDTFNDKLDTTTFDEYNLIQKEPTGFADASETSLLFNDTTREFTISPTGLSYDFYVKGVKFTKSAPETIIINDTTGNHYIYFDINGVLQQSAVFDPLIITDNAYVSIIYWNNEITPNKHIYFANERHGLIMDGMTHSYLHTIFGARFLSGGALQGFSIDDSTNTPTNANAQFTVDQGSIRDEDLKITYPAQSTIPILYQIGTHWRKKTADSFPVIYQGSVGGDYAGTRLPYNLLSAGVWSLAAVDNNKFVLVHIFATNDIENPVVGIQGINQYGSISEARIAATAEISQLSGLPFTEFVALGSVVFETSNAYTNTPKTKVRSISVGVNYVDFRGTQPYAPAYGAASSHSILSNLSSDDHLQYVLVNGTRNMTGALVMETTGSPAVTASLSSTGIDSTNSFQIQTAAGTHNINLSTANNAAGPTGDIFLQTGNAVSTNYAGSIYLNGGSNVDGNPANIVLTSGVSSGIGSNGSIILDSKNVVYLNQNASPSSSISASNHRIEHVKDPTAPQDAATFKWTKNLSLLNNVLYVSTTGSIFSGDGSLFDPYDSIATALTHAVDSDVIALMPGTYNEPTVVIPAALSTITFAGMSSASTTVTNGFSYTPTAANISVQFDKINTGQITFDGSSATNGVIELTKCSFSIDRIDTNPNILFKASECSFFGGNIRGTFNATECLFIASANVYDGLSIFENCKFVAQVEAYGNCIVRMLDCEAFGAPVFVNGTTVGIDTPIWQPDLVTDYLAGYSGSITKVVLANIPTSSSGIAVATYYDIDQVTADPNTDPISSVNGYQPDGTAVATGDKVLFGAYDGKIYQATNDGTNITWSLDASYTPDVGSLVSIQSGTAFGLQTARYDGSTYLFNDFVRYFNGSDYWEQSALYTVSLVDDFANEVYSIDVTNSHNMIVDYSIFRGTRKTTGTLHVTSDGTTAQISDTGVDLGTSVGASFSASIDTLTNILTITCTTDNSGDAGELKYSVKRWSDSPGGPGGLPSYTPTGPYGDITGSGGINVTNGTDATVGPNVTISADIDALLPSQTGNTGKFLSTNGSTASWQTVSTGGGGAALTFDAITNTGLTSTAASYDGSAAVTVGIDRTIVATLSNSQILTNKTISGSNNTLSNIANSSLVNSSITINGTPVSLGGSTTVTAAVPNALTAGSGLKFNTGTTFDGSSAKTISLDSSIYVSNVIGLAPPTASGVLHLATEIQSPGQGPFNILIETGQGPHNINSGDVTVTTGACVDGDLASTSGSSGSVNISTGYSEYLNAGNIVLSTGTGNPGGVAIRGDIELSAENILLKDSSASLIGTIDNVGITLETGRSLKLFGGANSTTLSRASGGSNYTITLPATGPSLNDTFFMYNGSSYEWKRNKVRTIQQLTSTAGGTYTPPADAKYIKVRMVGGGGGGGSGGSNGTSERGGGGGGGGGYLEIVINSPFAASYAWVVGAGGSGGAAPAVVNAGANGTAGSNTTFASHVAEGGAFGTAGFANNSQGGNGGGATLSGSGTGFTAVGSGGGAGENDDVAGCCGGSGGSSLLGGGARGSGTGASGVVSTSNLGRGGGGAGGGISAGGNGAAGGAGRDGIIIVEEFYSY